MTTKRFLAALSGAKTWVVATALAAPLTALATPNYVPGDNPGAAGLDIPEAADIDTVADFYSATCAVTQWILVFGLIIGVLFIIYGGVKYITSGGDSSKEEDAKKMILTAIIGVVFLVLAVGIVRIIAGFFGATNFDLSLDSMTCGSGGGGGGGGGGGVNPPPPPPPGP